MFQSFRRREEVCRQRRLQPAVLFRADVPLDQNTIFEFAIWMVGSVEILFLGDQRTDAHGHKIASRHFRGALLGSRRGARMAAIVQALSQLLRQNMYVLLVDISACPAGTSITSICGIRWRHRFRKSQ